MNTHSNYTFSRVPAVEKPRSTFNCDRLYKTTFDSGKLVPFYLKEIYPGDTVKCKVSAFARLTTPIVPFMDDLICDFFFFFVPNRLVWDNWQRFCGEQDNPGDSVDFLVPQVKFQSTGVGSLADYFGLPIYTRQAGLTTLDVSAFPFRAYNLIYNEFFRDENLQESVQVPKGDGPDSPDLYTVLRRGKRKDYFTSCLPFAQKGPGVELVIGGNAPVVGNGRALGLLSNLAGTQTRYLEGQANGTSAQTILNLLAGPGQASGNTPPMSNSDASTATLYNTAATYLGVSSNPKNSGLMADLTGVTAVTINALREAVQVQRWYEQSARSGSRYVETVLSFFGVHTGDARLQRPEYLGGGHMPIQVHSVAQTSSTDNTTPQGNLAAYGLGGTVNIGYSKSFVEHGFVIGLMSVRAPLTYQQGVDRFWSRQTKFDFYWPCFAHLGEQGVLNKEIYFSGESDVDNAVYGYQERWAELRYGISKVTGKLRSGIDGSLDCWHLGQYFTSIPSLSGEWIEDKPPVERVLAVQNEPQFIFDSRINEDCTRVLPMYSVPGLVDHF